MGKQPADKQLGRYCGRMSARLRVFALLLLALAACGGIGAQPQVGDGLRPTRGEGGDQSGGSGGGGGSGGM